MREKKNLDSRYSKGCRSCQEGKWLCIFLTYLCNAHCVFCPAPLRNEDRIHSAFGDTPDMILKSIQDKQVNGISFSGGDCFMVFHRLIEWLTIFKYNRKDIYYWCYTNGLTATKEKLKLLALGGMHEIRYNIAATGYNTSFILKQIAFSARIFPKVAVEIPSIPADFRKVSQVIPQLEKAGVAYLNLHEYITGPEASHSRRFLLTDQEEIYYDTRSIRNTRRIEHFCKNQGYKIQINNCSLKKKQNQMLKRHENLGEA